MVAFFADILRRLKTLQMVRAAFDRDGFAQDINVISKATSEMFLQATVGVAQDAGAGATAAPSSSSSGVSPPAQAPAPVQAAMRHLTFSTATVPMTDGQKMRLRHFGHGLNLSFGPLTTFSTHNYADYYSPLVNHLVDGTDVQVTGEPTMPTLQDMHKKAASSPRSTAKFWLFQQELSYRHLYGMDNVHIGRFQLHSPCNRYDFEDDYASSGAIGLAGYSISTLTPAEAQARGFTHGHDKKNGSPNSFDEQMDALHDVAALIQQMRQDSPTLAPTAPAQSTAATETRAAPESAPDPCAQRIQEYNDKLIACAVTRQYESSTLPGRQLGVNLPPTPFSALQQRQSRYDGLVEDDGITKREYLAVTPEETLAHIERETLQAAHDHREPRSAYSNLPLTGNQLSIYPPYQFPQTFGTERHVTVTGALDPQVACNHPLPRLPWQCRPDGSLENFLLQNGEPPTKDDFIKDAEQWEQCFSTDVRFLSAHNHNHMCATTCVKKMKKASAQEKLDAIKKTKAPPCRFYFFHVVVLYIIEGIKETVRRIRRRGKDIVTKPFVTATNEHNEWGLVTPERPQPFRSPTTDVGQATGRCNIDFRYMPRGFPNDSDALGTFRCDERQLALCFPDVSFVDLAHPVLRRMAYSVVALHVAASNCDYYITKYQAKNMEQLQNLTKQYALGIRRLEEEEALAARQAGDDYVAPTAADRARRITLRLQTAANRCTWVSSTEAAILVETGDTYWTSHQEIPAFLGKPTFMLQECRRLLHGRPGQLLQASHVPLDVIEYTVTEVPPEDNPTSSSTPPPARGEPPQAAAGDATDEDAHGDEHTRVTGDEQAAEDGDEDECHNDYDDHDPQAAEHKIDEGNSTFHCTSTRHDDWLHRGPLLHPLPFLLYLARVRRIRKPKIAGATSNTLFHFDSHYSLSALYCQQVGHHTCIPRLVGPNCKQADDGRGEEHALWHSVLFTTPRCPGPGACCDPTIFRRLFQADDAQLTKHRIAPAWRARLAELKVEACVRENLPPSFGTPSTVPSPPPHPPPRGGRTGWKHRGPRWE